VELISDLHKQISIINNMFPVSLKFSSFLHILITRRSGGGGFSQIKFVQRVTHCSDIEPLI